MRAVYAFEEADVDLPSIFLAGPTPRSPNTLSWRPEALRLIQKAQQVKPDVIPEVLMPEQRYGWNNVIPEDQYDWEHAAMESATVLLFWIPRVMETMPGLTTNIEWGRYIESGRVVVGWPNDAERNRYLEHDAARLGLTVHHDLPALVTAAFKMMNELQ